MSDPDYLVELLPAYLAVPQHFGEPDGDSEVGRGLHDATEGFSIAKKPLMTTTNLYASAGFSESPVPRRSYLKVI